jgi:predicted transposase YdaD
MIKDRGYSSEYEFWEVYCDNKLVDYCIVANDKEGWARYIDKDTIKEDSSYLTKVITGKIEFKLKWKEYKEMLQCRYWHI